MMIVVDVNIIVERCETVVVLYQCRHYHNITVEHSETVVLNWCRQNSWLSCHAYSIELNNTVLTVVSSKKWCHFLTTAGQRRPLFSPANGQFFISTRRWEACSRVYHQFHS